MDLREKAGRAVAAFYAPKPADEELIDATWRSHRRSVDVALIALAGDIEALIRAGDAEAWAAIVNAAREKQDEIAAAGATVLADMDAGLYDDEPRLEVEVPLSEDERRRLFG